MLPLIVDGCRALVAMADALGLSRVYLPMPGCTNGRLSYEGQVRQAIAAILDDRFIVAVPDLDRLPVAEGRAVVEGCDRDAASREILATASHIVEASDRLRRWRDVAALAGLAAPYDWYELYVAGDGVSMVFDPDFRLCPPARES